MKRLTETMEQLVRVAEAATKDGATEAARCAWVAVERECANMSRERPAFPKPYITRSNALVALGRWQDAEVRGGCVHAGGCQFARMDGGGLVLGRRHR